MSPKLEIKVIPAKEADEQERESSLLDEQRRFVHVKCIEVKAMAVVSGGQICQIIAMKRKRGLKCVFGRDRSSEAEWRKKSWQQVLLPSGLNTEASEAALEIGRDYLEKARCVFLLLRLCDDALQTGREDGGKEGERGVWIANSEEEELSRGIFHFSGFVTLFAFTV